MATTQQYPTAQSPTGFLDRQMNTYGVKPRQPAPQQTQQQAPAPFMPNGAPQPQPAPAPQVTGGGIATQPQQNVGTVSAQGVYKPGTAPNQTYQAQQISQFQAPQYQQMQGQQQGMVQNMLNNPYTLSPQVLSQMKGANTDQAALLARQTQGQLASQLAARGISTNSGMGMGQMRDVQMGMNQNVLNSNRQMDIQAALQNRQDEMQALGMADQFQNSALQRAIGGYSTNLQGMNANRDENMAQLQSGLANYNAGLQGQQLASQSQLGAIGNQLQGQSLSNQMSMFDKNFGLDTQKFDYQKTVDDRQFAAQSAAQGASNSQWEDQMAFQYQKAQQDEWNSLLSYMMGGGGGQQTYY